MEGEVSNGGFDRTSAYFPRVIINSEVELELLAVGVFRTGRISSLGPFSPGMYYSSQERGSSESVGLRAT